MEKIETDSSHERIVPYNLEWVSLYEAEASQLKEIFGNELLGIEHIGSTSIPGLSSKPIIDIMVNIGSYKDAEKFIPMLEKAGYSFDLAVHSSNPSPERYFFRKGNPTQYHLSVAYTDRGSFWDRQLAFRDYLRTHADERDRYADLKQNLISDDPTGKEGYISGKTDLINEMLDKSGFVRWKPDNK